MEDEEKDFFMSEKKDIADTSSELNISETIKGKRKEEDSLVIEGDKLEKDKIINDDFTETPSNQKEDVEEKQKEKKQTYKETRKETREKKTNNGEELSIDFSAMKKKATNFFKDLKAKKIKNDRENKDSSNKEEDYSFNFKGASQYVKKNSKWIVPLLFILIAVFVSSYFRMMPSDLPITDSWARDNVENFYKNQLTGQINQQYPNLPQQNRNILIQKEFEKFLEDNKELVNSQIAQSSQQIKGELQDENGDTYLLAIDPYLWYSQARNVINYGHLGDVKEDGLSKFSLRDGRLNKISSVQLNPYMGSYLFKFLSVFDRNLSLMRAMFLLPAILIGLAVIPAFFIGRKLSGNVGGLFAALFLVLNRPLLGRTPAGFADTDPYNILFPLLVAWFFLEAYDAKKNSHLIAFSSLAGLSVGLYSTAWSGWSNIFLFVIVTLVIVVGLGLIKNLVKSKFKFNQSLLKGEDIAKQIKLIIAFIFSSGIFVTIFQNFNLFMKGFTRPIKFITLKEVGLKSIWPNVLTTVAEFNTTSFSRIISEMGGNLLFWLGLMGIVFLLYDRKKNDFINISFVIGSGIYYAVMLAFRDQLNDPITFIFFVSLPLAIGILKTIYKQEEVNIVNPLLLALWLVGTAYAFSKGVRFSLLMVPVFSIALGTLFGFVFKYGSQMLTKGIKLDKTVGKITIFIILALFLITPVTEAKKVGLSEIPSMNDAWYNTLTKIKQDGNDGIITSWWDFGHWFVAIAQRRVTFDGGDQGERIHWVGRSLLTSNENEARGILRMLNCAQEEAPHKLEEFVGDSLKSVQIIKDVILISDREQARQKYLDSGLSSEEARVMLDYTHCQNLIPNYYITSEDMVGKAGVWGHFGSWNFEKATMYQNTRKLSRPAAISYLTERFGLSEIEADKIHQEIQTNKGDQWIAPWPGYLGGFQPCDRISDNQVACIAQLQEGAVRLIVDIETFDVIIEGNPSLVPNAVVFPTKNNIEEKKLQGDKIGVSIVLLPDGDMNYRFMLTSPEQAASMFTRLFFYEGHGLKCFSEFDDVRQFTGSRISTWKVDYDCKQENKVFG